MSNPKFFSQFCVFKAPGIILGMGFDKEIDSKSFRTLLAVLLAGTSMELDSAFLTGGGGVGVGIGFDDLGNSGSGFSLINWRRFCCLELFWILAEIFLL